MTHKGWRVVKPQHNQKLFVPEYTYDLLHCRLNELPHTIYWKSSISILGTSGYEI